MQKLLIIFIIAGLFVSCRNTTVEKETYPDGKVKTEKTYRETNGEKELVKEVHYYSNGKKYIEGNYKNNKREGYWASWYENGQLWSEGDFKDGLSEGKRTVYHQNGKLYYEGDFIKGERTGIWKFYDEKGNVTNEVDYTKNKTGVKE
ncbi:MAG: toxin-antitoxin system YwqK family antitoxin [Omnitrophica WOR_2 bacterium]